MIADISAGGLYMIVKHLNPDQTAGLHRQWLYITAFYNADENSPPRTAFKKLARVVSVQAIAFDEWIVHVTFKDPIDEKRVVAIAQKRPLTCQG